MSKGKSQPIDGWSPRRIAIYNEAGNMLRHYSASRTAVLSLVLPICLGILGWGLSAGQHKALMIYLLIAEGLLFSYGLSLSMFFSVKYEQTRQFLVKIEAGGDLLVYNSVVSLRLRDLKGLDGIDKSILVVGLVLHAGYYIYYFTS